MHRDTRGGVGEAMEEMVARAVTMCAKYARSYTHACNTPRATLLVPRVEDTNKRINSNHLSKGERDCSRRVRRERLWRLTHLPKVSCVWNRSLSRLPEGDGERE